MMGLLKPLLAILVSLLLQVVVFPVYLADTFKPNLLLIVAVHLGLRETTRYGWCLALLAGLVQDCFSGLYLGLNGFICLGVYLSLQMVTDYLYADSRYLLVVVVFLATIAGGVLELFLLAVYSAAEGIYAVLLPALLPQALVNSLAAAILAATFSRTLVEARQ